MAGCVIEGLRRPDPLLACLNAAGLAEHLGWRFLTIQQTPEGHTFIQEIPASNRQDFEAKVRAGLRLAPHSALFGR